ncbi:PK1L1 protein, partial [Polypterus senegalus]
MISKSLMVRNNGTEESMQMLTDGIRTTTELLLINENVADLTLYNCKTRRKIDVNGLTSPVIIEFQKNEINETSELNFSLLQDKMNIHQFNVTSDKQTEYLQITLNFTRPPERVFPIMILYRKFEKPTPRLYNFQQVFQWKGNTVQLFLSPDSLNAKGSYYLALLSANYDRKPTNKYTASAVSYSLSIQWISCLYWDNVKEWKTDGCLPMQSLSSSKLNCSQPDNLVPCIVIFFTLIIYIPLAFLCKRFDIQNEKKRAPVYLQDNNPSDKQLYAICIDTGFRSRTYTTAKVKFSKESPVEQLSSTEASAIYNVEGRKEVFTLLMTVPVALKTVAYQKIKFQPLSLVMTSVQSILLIFITAVAVTLKCKDISSIYVGFHKTNPNFESRKWQPSKDSCQSKKCLPTFDHKQLASSLDYDKLIAARQRSRYLRLVRPPSHLQLKEARERIRKEALIQQTLRTEMIDILTQLKSVGWLDKNTKAVVVQFTLYNPPSNLFTTVSFLMEISAGTVFSSTLIESANVYQIISIFDYLIMAFEVINFVYYCIT